MSLRWPCNGHSPWSDLASFPHRPESTRCAGIRAEIDTRPEKISYKVREHSVAKVPVQLAVGHREVENRSVAVRRLGSKQQKVLPLDEALSALETEVRERR